MKIHTTKIPLQTEKIMLKLTFQNCIDNYIRLSESGGFR